MSHIDTAGVFKVREGFSEIVTFGFGLPGEVTAWLSKDVPSERKQGIAAALKKYEFNTGSFIFPVVEVSFYGNKEPTTDEKRKIAEALRGLARVMHDCGIHFSETKLAFSVGDA